MSNPTLDQIINGQLPKVLTSQIPEEYRDQMGHLNIRYYMALYDDAEWNLAKYVGMDKTYFEQGNGIFDLAHHILYLREVEVGDTVSIYFRLLGKSKSSKRIHCILYMVNDTKQVLASTLEMLQTHSDLKLRRASEFGEVIMKRIDEVLEEHKKIEWQPTLSGAIDPK